MHHRIAMNEDFDKMSEQEILDEIAQVIPECTRGGKFIISSCVERQEQELRRLYKRSHGIGAYDKVPKETLYELEVLTAHFLPLIVERTTAAKQKFDKKQILHKINSTTALAILLPALEAEGMKADAICQQYRLKVKVDLNGKRKLCFTVGYKALCKPGAVEAVVQAVKDCREALCRLGGDVRITK